jgi:hypothetical protein
VRPIEQVGTERVRESWYDIETVYGYSGPLSTSTEPSFLTRAWQIFDEWCSDEGIVAEFIRFNPLMDNHRYMDDSCAVVLDRETVALRLDYSADKLWESYRRGHRTEIRKALKKGLIGEEVDLSDGLEPFKRMYDQTMDRRQAGDYYYFTDAYYDHLRSALGDRLKLFTVRDGDHLVAAVMFLAFGQLLHAHLGGSDANYKGIGPNNLLYHTASEWGRENGFQWLHVGGGLTNKPDDSLFRFKTGLTRSRFPFYIGKRIHDKKAYDALCSEWMSQSEAKQQPNRFLLYRLAV